MKKIHKTNTYPGSWSWSRSRSESWSGHLQKDWQALTKSWYGSISHSIIFFSRSHWDKAWSFSWNEAI